MSNSERLDDTDRRLLRLLQAEGRISNQELAERSNLSPSACSDRVRRLRESGYIRSFKDMAAYRAFLGDVLVQMPGVRETRTYAVLEEVKSTGQLPV